MKLFLSWSGEISHKLAVYFREWIPLVLQSVDPYVSSEDIDKGTRWSSDIAQELEESNYGIICVTHQNLKAPWINFEAGALSKALDKANVAPFLFNIKKSEVDGPLVQFQLTVFEKNDFQKLIHSINKASGTSNLTSQKLDKIFDQWWPDLEDNLNKLSIECQISQKEQSKSATKQNYNTLNDKILEELLELSRLQTKLLSNPSALLPLNYLFEVVREVTHKGDGNSYKYESIARELMVVYKQLDVLHRSATEDKLGIVATEKVEEMGSYLKTFGKILAQLIDYSKKDIRG